MDESLKKSLYFVLTSMKYDKNKSEFDEKGQIKYHGMNKYIMMRMCRA